MLSLNVLFQQGGIGGGLQGCFFTLGKGLTTQLKFPAGAIELIFYKFLILSTDVQIATNVNERLNRHRRWPDDIEVPQRIGRSYK